MKELALCLSASDLRRVSWREGTRGTMHSRFARLRVRVAHRDYWRSEPHPQQWLLIEWPKTEKEPTKYWLSNLPEAIRLRQLVATAKLRWRIERDYEELKQELGLGHYEGRELARISSSRHALPIAAYGFLVLERCLFPPAPGSPPLRAVDIRFRLPTYATPATRLAALPVRTERHNPSLDRHTAPPDRYPPGPLPAQMSLLPSRLLITQ